MERILKSNKGYSFAEVVIAMVIMGIVALLMGTILTTSTKMHRSSFSSDDAYAVAREKLAEFQNEGTSVSNGTDVVDRNGISYQRQWVITQGANATDPVKAVITVIWDMGTITKDISITGYIEALLCPTIVGNQAPSNILLSNPTIAKNSSANTLVGTLKVIDPDSSQGDLAKLFIDDSFGDHNKFKVSGNNLLTSIDNIPVGTYSIKITAEDCGGDTATVQFSLNVIDALLAPSINPQTLGKVPENCAGGVKPSPNFTVVASGGNIKYSISSSAFKIDSILGEISVISSSSLDYESDSTPTLLVTVTNDSGFDTATITIGLSNENEAPTLISPSNQKFYIDQYSNNETQIHSGFTTQDQDNPIYPNDHVYTVLEGGVSSTRFRFSEDTLKPSMTMINAGEFPIEVVSTDNKGGKFTSASPSISTPCTVNVIPVLDPVIDPSQEFNVSEAASDGDNPYTVTLQQGSNVTFTMTNDPYNAFDIHPTTGVISVDNSSNIPPYGTSPFFLKINAKNSSPNESNDSIKVSILSSDPQPVFSPNSYNISIPNSTVAGPTVIQTLTGTLTNVTFSIDDDSYFDVNSSGGIFVSGDLTTAGSSLSLEVIATNGAGKDTANLNITITSGGAPSGTFTHTYSVGASAAGYDHSSKPYQIGSYGSTGGGWHMYTKTTSSDISGNISSIDFTFNSVVWASGTPGSTVSIKILGASGTPSAGDATVHSFTPTSGSSTISTTWSGSDLAKYFNGTSGYGIYFDCSYGYQSYWFAFSSISVTLN